MSCHLDLHTISLERFKQTLATSELLPGRLVLSEDLEARFARLAAAGVLHSKHLFERGMTPADRAALAAETGLPPAALLELVRLSDLARPLGIGPAFVRLFIEAGADSIESLAGWDPQTLWQAAHAVNRGRAITRVVPSLKDVQLYVQAAQELPKVIEY